jgi:hypothetical protein
VDGGKRQIRTSLVLDFGMLRTVSAVAVLNSSTLQVLQVKPWTGMGFADSPVFNTSGTPWKITADTGKLTGDAWAVVPLPSEVKTERLQIDLAGTGTEAALGESVLVQLPDVPADLDLRINGGPSAWSAPGAAAAGVGGWNAASADFVTQTIDLSQALTALLGAPTADKTDMLEIHLVLAARTPGALTLDLPPEGSRTIRYITQVTQGFLDGRLVLTFPEEGRGRVPLPLPPWAKRVEEVRVTLEATLPPERTIPPLGPDADAIPASGGVVPFAELVLDPDHAASLPLEAGMELTGLAAVRLPLRAEPGGAEVRVLLLDRDSLGEPGAARDGGASTPVTLEPTPDSGDRWTTFAFPAAVPLAAPRPFAALVVSRGRVTLSLARVPLGESALPGAGEVWIGPPTGPWQRLPAMGVLDRMRGRIRMTGRAGKEKPLSPLRIHLEGATGAAVPVTPTPKGVPAIIRPASGIAVDSDHTVSLIVESLVGGAVTIRDVRVLASDA